MERPSDGDEGPTTVDEESVVSAADAVAIVTAGSDPSIVDAVRKVVEGLDRTVDAVLVDADSIGSADGDPTAASNGGDHREWVAAVGSVPAVAVAVGRTAVAPVAEFVPSVPVVPAACGRLSEGVPVDRLASALDAVLDGERTERRRPVVSVSVDGDPVARAAFDVALVADEPATISEFAVRDRSETVDVVRADGVVAATPWASDDYARAAGGGTLAHGVDALSVVPVAPFTTDRPRWVLPTDDVAITVERDEVGVRLQVDGRDRIGLGRGETVTVSRCGSVVVASPEVGPE